MHAKLVVVGGDAKAAEINLKLPTIIGRGRNASLTLAHPLVSRQHCEIVEHEGRLLVRDLGSLNGTFVGNERITESILGPGELLTVGTVTFRAVYEAPRTSGKGRPGTGRRPTETFAAETLPAAGNSETVDFTTAGAGADGQPDERQRRTSDSAETEPFPPGPASVPSHSANTLPAEPVREALGRSGAVFHNAVDVEEVVSFADDDVEADPQQPEIHPPFAPNPNSSQTSDQQAGESSNDEPVVEGADDDLRSFLKGLQ